MVEFERLWNRLTFNKIEMEIDIYETRNRRFTKRREIHII